MSIEERIYEKLRTVASTRKLTAKGADDRDLRRARAHTRGQYLERFTDFTPTEVKFLLLEEQLAKKFYGLIGSGKEANVYHIKDFDNRHLAVKMFRVHATTHNYNTLHSKNKLSDTAKLSIATSLCKNEFEKLAVAYKGGVRVPRPIWRKGFFYAAEMIGQRHPAPLLTKVKLADPKEIMDDALEQLDMMFNSAQMAHGDYLGNLLLHNNKLFVIDFYQSKLWHPKYDTPVKIRLRDALPILKRDIEGLLTHFKNKYRISYDIKTVFEKIPDIKVNDDLPDELMEDL